VEKGGGKEKGKEKDAWTPFRTHLTKLKGSLRGPSWVGRGKKKGKKRGNGSRLAEASTFKGAFLRARRLRERSGERTRLPATGTGTQRELEPGSYFPRRYEELGMDASRCYTV